MDENEILITLEKRFNNKIIYTETGSILLALNPYCQVNQLYGASTLQKYMEYYEFRLSSLEEPDPHVYSIAAKAHHAMLNTHEYHSDHDKNKLGNQSILVSGESGNVENFKLRRANVV